MKRTSATHPLQIVAVSAGDGFGRVGITFCPGKYDPAAMSGYWERNLDLDLDAICVWGAAAVVTLLEPHEFALLRVERLGAAVRMRDMYWFHLPIPDAGIPSALFEEQWEVVGGQLRALLRDGRDVLVHCRGGLGRAGTIAARLLIELGMSPEMAVKQVRAVRPGAIENEVQHKYVLGVVAKP